MSQLNFSCHECVYIYIYIINLIIERGGIESWISFLFTPCGVNQLIYKTLGEYVCYVG